MTLRKLIEQRNAVRDSIRAAEERISAFVREHLGEPATPKGREVVEREVELAIARYHEMLGEASRAGLYIRERP